VTTGRGDDREGAPRGRRAARREGRGLVAVLLGTTLLGVLGFGLGIVAGLFLEEPGLLLDYVTGRTTSTRIEAPPPERLAAVELAPVDVPTAPPAEAPPAPTHPRVTATAPPEPPSVAAPPPTPVAPPAAADPPPPELPPAHAAQSGYAVQVGALADAASADQLAAKLEARGFRTYVAPSAEPGARRWRVRVGPVATREEAQRLAEQLGREKLPTWVLAEGRR
jgi:DedD protein